MSQSRPDDVEKRGRARERQRRRRQRTMAQPSRPKQQQTTPTGALKLPKISLPANRLIYILPFGIAVFFGVIAFLAFVKDDEPEAFSNAIWLRDDWTYADPNDEDMFALSKQLQDNQIGIVYAFVSALAPDNTWSGDRQQGNRFVAVERLVTTYVERMRQFYPGVEMYGWLEVYVNLDEDGYRLDEPALHQNVANFSKHIVNDLGFDGVLLDVKPIWNNNDDLLALLRAVRREIGLDTPLAVVMSPDLTPQSDTLQPLNLIAQRTQWDKDYKQRVAIPADHIVITAYHSYRSDPLDYINWVAYQVEAYYDALDELDNDTASLVISIPDYAEDLPAHNPAIESIGGALDGIKIGLAQVNENNETPFSVSVALYADGPVSEDNWQVYRQKWLGQ